MVFNTPLRPDGPYTPMPAKEDQAFRDLVAQYVCAKDPSEAHAINERLVREYKIDLNARTYNKRQIPVNPKKAIDIVAQIGYELFRLERKAEISPQRPFGMPAQQLSRMINLFHRLVEVKTALLRTPEAASQQKVYLAHARDLIDSAQELLEVIENKVDGSEIMRAFLEEMRVRLIDVERAIKKKSVSEAGFYLVHMSDKTHQLKERSSGILKRLFEQTAVSHSSSYLADQAAIKAHLQSCDDLFSRYDQDIVQRKPWGQLRTAADSLKKELAKLPSSEKPINVHQSLHTVNLHLKATFLLHELMEFVQENVENAFDDI